MVKHNNVIPNGHFHKKWDTRIKMWFSQPAQKKIRRERRKAKAAAIAPRPATGSLRPLVHCPTQRYSAKVKYGRGFSLEELKGAGISRKYASTVGIAVDHRRSNKSNDSLATNVDRLKEYMTKLIVFPRKSNRAKKVHILRPFLLLLLCFELLPHDELLCAVAYVLSAASLRNQLCFIPHMFLFSYFLTFLPCKCLHIYQLSQPLISSL
jgi:ribosomal protein L13E